MLKTVYGSSLFRAPVGRTLALVLFVVSLLLGMSSYANAATPTGTVGGTLTVDLGRFGTVPASWLVVGLYNAADGDLAYATTAEQDGSFFFADVNPGDYIFALIDDDYTYTILGETDIRIPSGMTHSQRDLTLLTVDDATGAQQVPTAVTLSNIQSATHATALYFAILFTIGLATVYIAKAK